MASLEEIKQHLTAGKALKVCTKWSLLVGGRLDDLYRPVQVKEQAPVYAEARIWPWLVSLAR